jgi:tetratricopeptide (TPR) repeat protein
MYTGNDPVAALREALRLSPDNLPLRQHLAETLLGLGRPEEAEKELKAALSKWPDNSALKLGLATAFSQQGKNSPALVIVEELLKLSDPPAKVYVLHARLLLRAGDGERAVRQYKRGVELDPAVADAELASRFGVYPESQREQMEEENELFEQARRKKPCVLFFDEVDALAASRSDLRQSASRLVINQFLSELDGVQSSKEGVLILAATNAPWHLDSAFRRPGRFDRILFVPPPDAAARAAILRIHTRGKPVQDIDYEHIARKTEHFSGADLKAVVDVAIENKLREAMKDGIPKPMTTKDLLSAAAGVRPSTREWFSTARNYALYSNQGGVYDDILKYLKM